MGSFRASRSAVNPNFHLGHRVRTRERRQRAARAWIPSPADEIIRRDVFQYLLQRASASLPGIFQLITKLRGRASDKNHLVLRGWKGPFRISRRHVLTREIRGLMTSVTAHAVDAMAVFAAPHVLQMDMTVVALKR